MAEAGVPLTSAELQATLASLGRWGVTPTQQRAPGSGEVVANIAVEALVQFWLGTAPPVDAAAVTLAAVSAARSSTTTTAAAAAAAVGGGGGGGSVDEAPSGQVAFDEAAVEAAIDAAALGEGDEGDDGYA